MLSLVLFFLLISSGGVYAVVRHGRRYEEAVPLTIFCGVEVIFLFGLADSLKLGVWAACAIAAALYALSARELRRQWRDRKKIYERLFTPAFFIFLILLVLYARSVSGRVACYNDDFSFWASSVKKMWYEGKFACAVEKNPGFTEYPPGMGLIQYALMVLRGEFTDWRLYFAYAAYIFALFLPFLKRLRFRPLPVLALAAALVISGGTILYPTCWDSLTVDLALGATFAYGLASLFSLGEEGQGVRPFALANIVMTANMLVLIKSAGTLLAVILLVILLISAWLLRSEALSSKAPAKKARKSAPEPDRRRWGRAAAYVFAVCLPLITNRLWKVKYSLYDKSPAFDTGKYDFSEFLRIMLSQTDGGYRGGIKKSFFSYVTQEGQKIGWLSLTNVQLVLLLASAFLVICYLYRKSGSRRVHACAVCAAFCFELVYWLGLLCSYMYTFSEEEGVELASIQRYLNIYHTGILLCAVFLLLKGGNLLSWNPLLFSAVLAVTLSLTSGYDMQRLLTRTTADESVFRNRIAQSIADQLPEEEDAILLVIYKKNWPHIPVLQMRYLAYDGYTVPFECCFGSQLQEGDTERFLKIMTAGEFHQHVYELGADYIAMENLDDDFVSTYSSLFDTPLANGQIYRVPEDGGLFELIRTASWD